MTITRVEDAAARRCDREQAAVCAERDLSDVAGRPAATGLPPRSAAVDVKQLNGVAAGRDRDALAIWRERDLVRYVRRHAANSLCHPAPRNLHADRPTRAWTQVTPRAVDRRARRSTVARIHGHTRQGMADPLQPDHRNTTCHRHECARPAADPCGSARHSRRIRIRCCRPSRIDSSRPIAVDSVHSFGVEAGANIGLSGTSGRDSPCAREPPSWVRCCVDSTQGR